MKTPREILKIDHVSYKNSKNIKKVDGLSLSVKAGEILGIAGVDGNGQEELVEMICGLRNMDEGDIRLDGESIKNLRAWFRIWESDIFRRTATKTVWYWISPLRKM